MRTFAQAAVAAAGIALIAASNSNFVYYASANQAGTPLLEAELRDE